MQLNLKQGVELSGLNRYNINISNLKNEDYYFKFNISNSFFEHFENSEVEEGKLEVTLKLKKSENLIELVFDIQGEITLTCDRSLELFEFPVTSQRKLLLKFGAHNEQVTEELEVISRGTVMINVAQYLYEFIVLEIPMKKLHPKFVEDLDEEDDESEAIFIYSSEEEAPEVDEPKPDEENEVDPRWQILKKFKK